MRKRRRVFGRNDSSSESETEKADCDFLEEKKQGKGTEATKFRRQVIKIHGVSVAPDGEWLFAVSFAKSRTFQYLTHEVMKNLYPNYLIGFYERHLKLGDVVDPNKLMHPPRKKRRTKSGSSPCSQPDQSQ